MGLMDLWKNYKVLIVMGTSMGLIHWGWYNLKSSPMLQKNEEKYVPEAGIITYVSSPAAPPLPPLAAKNKEVSMKPQSWIRRNWLWAAGGAFATVHLATWILQKVMKSSVRSEVALRQQTPGGGQTDGKTVED